MSDLWTASIGPVVEFVKYTWSLPLKHAKYICNLQGNLSSLREDIDRLRAVRDEVTGRVQLAEAQQRPCRPVVKGWLERVEVVVDRVTGESKKCKKERLEDGCSGSVQGAVNVATSVLEQGKKELEGRCSSCCPRFNCWGSYKLGKEVVKLIVQVETLTKEANAPEFQEVADLTGTILVQGIPGDPIADVRLDVEPSQGHAPPTQPQDTVQPVAGTSNTPQENTDQSDLAKALQMIGDAGISYIGIYGMGGVGKTFLLDNINNHFLQENADQWKVIHVVVSRPINLGRIQKKIGQRLGFNWEGDSLAVERRNIIFNMLSKMKFLLLLDDCWERVDLRAVGVPSPLQCQIGGKVIFTTRRMEVCGRMGAVKVTKTIKVKCLNEDKALQLFKRVVGDETLNSDSAIPELARDVARECCGLPLALVTIGMTMVSKKTASEWRNCLDVLKTSGAGTLDPEITDVTELEIFAKLKFSYDDLREVHKPCFEYCALYPEDCRIVKDELIRLWMGMGFIEQRSMDEAYDCGYGVIETLKAVNLLESVVQFDVEYVKMHDTIRDFAIWIGRECGKRVDKILVQSGEELSEAPLLTPQCCSEVERISLMQTSIRSLGDPPAACTNLSTLLLKNSLELRDISESVFQFMPALKVLNLSRTKIRGLPTSISHLVALEFLDLSWTTIERVPDELRNLVKLKYLDLSYTYHLTMIPQGVISHLRDLKVLNLHKSCYENWRVEDPGQVQAAGTADIGVRVSELQELRHLTALGLTVSSSGVLQFLLAHERLRLSITSLKIENIDRSAVSMKVAPSAAVTGTSSSDLRGVKNLRSLDIEGSDSSSSLKELTVTWRSTGFKRVENLVLSNLKALTTLTIQRDQQSITPTLQFVFITGCDALEDLNCFASLPLLKRIDISNCSGLKKIINNGVVETNTIIFPGLKELYLLRLPMLESIYEHTLPFPHLDTITVGRCPLLRRLPFDSNSAKNTLQNIKGEEEWWNNLQWENDEIRTSFQKYFHKTIWYC